MLAQLLIATVLVFLALSQTQAEGVLVWGSGNWGAAPWQADDLDDDNDGMPDTWELSYNLNPLDSSDATSDTDNDNLIAIREYLASSDPTDIDSDNDGINDDDDFAPLDAGQWRMMIDSSYKGVLTGPKTQK